MSLTSGSRDGIREVGHSLLGTAFDVGTPGPLPAPVETDGIAKRTSTRQANSAGIGLVEQRDQVCAVVARRQVHGGLDQEGTDALAPSLPGHPELRDRAGAVLTVVRHMQAAG